MHKYCSTGKNEYCLTENINLNEISKPGITQPFGISLTHTLMMGF